MLLIAPNENAGSAKIGGVFGLNKLIVLTTTLSASIDLEWEQGKWQQTFESVYKKEEDAETLNEVFVNTKANYT